VWSLHALSLLCRLHPVRLHLPRVLQVAGRYECVLEDDRLAASGRWVPVRATFLPAVRCLCWLLVQHVLLDVLAFAHGRLLSQLLCCVANMYSSSTVLQPVCVCVCPSLLPFPCRAAAARVCEPAAGHPVQRLRAARRCALPLCVPSMPRVQLLQHPYRLNMCV
jgi:hypothetical protein